MRDRYRDRFRDKDHNPAKSIGVFLIVFGLFLMAIFFDILNFGNPREYIRWQMFLIFIGFISLFSRNSVGGVIMIAIGSYFLLPELDFYVPELVEKVYWPSAIVLAGIVFVISGIVRKNKNYRNE